MKSLTAAQKKSLHKAALAVRKNSYSPYSGYKVAAAVLTEDGEIFGGVNIENASYGATICAERSAIFSAVIAGAKKLKGVLVLTDEKDPWPPCGMCRQVIAEFADAKTPILIANKKAIKLETTLSEILPFTFKKEHLKK